MSSALRGFPAGMGRHVRTEFYIAFWAYKPLREQHDGRDALNRSNDPGTLVCEAGASRILSVSMRCRKFVSFETTAVFELIAKTLLRTFNFGCVLCCIYGRGKSHWIHNRSSHRRSPRAAGLGIPVQVFIDWFVCQVTCLMKGEQWECEHGLCYDTLMFVYREKFFSPSKYTVHAVVIFVVPQPSASFRQRWGVRLSVLSPMHIRLVRCFPGTPSYCRT